MSANSLQTMFQQARQAYGSRHYAQALQISQRLVSLAGPREEFLNIQAMSLLALGRALDAAGMLDRALKKNPKSTGMLLNAARIDLVLARRRSAKRRVMEAVRLASQDARVLYQASISCRQLDDYGQAMRLVERCQQVAPDLVEAWHLKGSMLLDRGDKEQALEQLRHALSLQPTHARALADLSRVEDDAQALDKVKAQLEQLAAKAPSPWDRSAAQFALADLAHRAGDVEGAALLYREANEEGAKVRPFAMDQWLQKQRKTLEDYAELEPLGKPGEGHGAQLVFLVGMPRSGTSLCEQVLGAHAEVWPCGELNSMDAIELYLAQTLSKDAQRRAYLDALPVAAGKAQRVTDKLPMNFERVGMIHQLFPGARFVHCQREPMDTILSCYQQDFQAGVQWAFDLENIASVAMMEQELMQLWRARLPGHVLQVPYEEMVGDLPAQAARLSDFLALPPDSAMLEPHQSQRTVATASRMQVRKAIYASSVGKWKSYEPLLQPARALLDAHEGSD